MLKSICDIQTVIIEANQALNEHLDSLNRELAWMNHNHPDARAVRGKETQIFKLKLLQEMYITIFDSITGVTEMQFKLEACAVYYGVSLYEIKHFMSRPVNEVHRDIKITIEENTVHIPDQLKYLLHPVTKREPTEIKISEKPIIPFETLKKLALSG